MFNYYFNDYLIKDTTDPISYSLMKIDWRIFGTLTYNYKYFYYKNISEKEMTSLCPKKFFFSLRSKFRLNSKNLEFYYINEKDKQLKTHIHFLISRKALLGVNYFELLEFSTSKWNALNGLCNTQQDIQIVDNSKKERLIRYCSKRTTSVNGIVDNDYFISKPLLKTLKRLA